MDYDDNLKSMKELQKKIVLKLSNLISFGLNNFLIPIILSCVNFSPVNFSPYILYLIIFVL